jgi:hypothetical protein
MAVVIIVVVIVVIVVIVGVLARRGAGKATARVQSRLAELEIERQAKATFHGLASAGEGQVRRLGTLVLTPDTLLFVQFVPEGEVSIRRAAVTAVEASATYGGTTHASDLLVVAFGADGVDGTDQAAWELPDVAAWSAALQP